MLPLIKAYPCVEGERVRTWERVWANSHSPYSVLLESGKDGRYTFLGLQPSSVLVGGEEGARLLDKSGGEQAVFHGRPLDVLRRWMEAERSPVVAGAPKWVGGAAGFLSYDLVRTIETLPKQAEDDLQLPAYVMMKFEELWIFDHQAHCLYCAVHMAAEGGVDSQMLAARYADALERISAMKTFWDEHAAGQVEHPRETRFRGELQRDTLQVDVAAITGVKPDFERNAYMEAVRRIQDYIRQGDVFQVNLSVRQSKRLEAKPEEIYEWLRLVNPSPYMGMLRTPELQLVSGSPELLVQLEGSRVRSRPIAGTRPRGATPEEDAGLAEELLASEKERAEHIMLVDLERNDLGRISRYGSVRVDELMVIERYSHVMHLVSEVTGELAAGRDAFDVIAATFPGGTITGAPKIRTMQIIEELEPVRRGPYTGSMGWIDYNGNMELNIVIRTLAVRNGIGYVQAGAGIVIDSDPEREYIESINKAKAMWKAIQFAERYR
jgi:para-aminobenzoate synthetase component 1